MTMEYIRKIYGVPAKRGMQVVPKTGRREGQAGYIRSASGGTLVIVDVPRGRYNWYSLYHPADLDYKTALPANA